MSYRPKIYIDFEFNEVLSEKVNLVSCVTYVPGSEPQLWWLYKDKAQQKELKEYLSEFVTFYCWSAVAEARCFYSLGLDPLSFGWQDGFLDYRCLLNHNDDLKYGKQLIAGRVVFCRKPPPKFQRVEITEEEDPDADEKVGFRATGSLAEASFKLIGVIRDTEEKDQVRDLIIADKDIEAHQQRILDYNREDVVFLRDLEAAIYEKFAELGVPEEEIYSDSELRGRYAACTAIMESKGYPIDFEATQNFSRSVLNILLDVQREINELFPDIKPFRWDKKNGRYSWDQKKTREWITANCDAGSWQKTDTGELSLSLEAWTRTFDFKHDYPTDNFGAQIVRFLKLKQSLYGFVPTIEKKKKTFWDFVGPDKRVRPYMNIYGAQSGRSQPAASGFMFLKPAWMRSLVIPNKGMAICGVDYASQEFFISALLAEDKNMIDAYLSGDVYLAFGKQVGMIPPDGTKADYKKERDLCKSTVLGLSYNMSKYGLANKLTQDAGRVYDPEEAQELIDLFYENYWRLKEFQDNLQAQYKEERHIRIYDGWYMWGDNDNFRSVGNIPIQGFGAAVMREAVYRTMSQGIYVPFTLHDAVYIEYKVGNEHEILQLMENMKQSFAESFEGTEYHDIALQIRLDPFAWSRDYEQDSEIVLGDVTIPVSDLYRDERAVAEHEKFKRYFDKPDADFL